MPEKNESGVSNVFKDFLFYKGYLVNDTGEDREDCVRALYALANIFSIKIAANPHLASWDMVDLASTLIGRDVPEPFYRGFPQSVLALREDQLLMDQMIHYAVTYGLGDFSRPGHSLFEEHFERLAFKEGFTPKTFSIVEKEEAMALMKTYVQGMLASTRPLMDNQQGAVLEYAKRRPDDIAECNCKDTAIFLLYNLKQPGYARFLQLPDVIRLADEINYKHGLPSKKEQEAQQEYREKKAQWDKGWQEYRVKLSAYHAAIARYNEDMAQYQDKLRQYKESSFLNQLFKPQPQMPVKPLAPPPKPQEPCPAMPRPVKKSIRTLNLKNQDRKLIARVIDYFFEQEREPNIRACYEKRRDWIGLLHHIHYAPVNPRAAAFAEAMRGDGANRSVYSGFEAAMAQGKIREAAALLAKEKGSGAVARNLNYLLSRCKDAQDVSAVLDSMGSPSLILLIQLLLQYNYYHADERTFRFVRHNLMASHKETPEEWHRRRSVLSAEMRAIVEERLSAILQQKLASRKIGKVYVEDGMKKIAIPLQEATGAAGFGVLPRSSRVGIGDGKKVRCFTYWEKVNDIDLACFGLEEEGNKQIEFSWRTMWNSQSESIVYSGDETSGYQGGSEFFDLRIPEFRDRYPTVRYVVFTDCVYSDASFSHVLCTAGCMIRDEQDSGAVFEPKTVKTSFRITANSTFAYLFALDLKERELVWLNLGLDSLQHVAGRKTIAAVRDYLNVTDVFNLAMLFLGMASEVVQTPEEADVIVADHYEGPLRERQTLIRSCDTEKVLAYLNAK